MKRESDGEKRTGERAMGTIIIQWEKRRCVEAREKTERARLQKRVDAKNINHSKQQAV
ncbi:MAG: hypothetical protein U9N51_00965 [Bacteroidota bacterium]|nr:hypothetical protein [Bacteroidota bacterium]